MMKQSQTLLDTINRTQKSKSLFISTNNNKTNRLTSRKPTNKKHCPQDIACLHCCQCWLNFQQQYNKRIKYFQTKVNDLTSQNDLLKKCIQQLSIESQKLKKTLKNNTDPQTIKQKIRKQLIEQLDSQIKMKDLLQQQKITTLTQKLQQNKIQIDQLQHIKKQLQQKLQQQINKLKELNKQYDNSKILFEKEIKSKQKEILEKTLTIQNLNQQVDKLKQRINTIDLLIKQKDGSINSMKSTIDHSDRLIEQQMSKMAQKQSQKHKLHLQFSNKSQQLNKLQKITQQHSKSIILLSNQKNKLYDLVDSLKDELIQREKQNHILKLTLNDAQFVAREKSISLQNLKYDVNMLKYTLP